jgi:hypothetical protein
MLVDIYNEINKYDKNDRFRYRHFEDGIKRLIDKHPNVGL